VSAPRQLTYSDYLRVPQLLDQQRCLAEDAHDELQFIVVHQVYELWFKLVLHELDTVGRLLGSDDERDARRAVHLLARVDRIFGVLVDQIHVLETMRPADFMAFRKHLNPASGFQSVQFREVECALGLEDERLVGFTRDDPRHDALLERLAAPSVADALYGWLRRRGHAVTVPGEERGEDEQASTLAALKTIYDAPDDHPLEYAVCEAFVEVDEKVVLWRRHHVMMVERQLGDKPGTGKGTTGELDGIRYLKTTLMRKALPDLWAVRTILED